ncbi:MAG: hypothetical protein WD844_11965 [Thermoleophilaceae bacterium]
MSHRFRTVAVAALVLLAAGAAPGEASARETEFGVNAQKLVFEQPPATWGRHFDGMASADLGAARIDALWQAVEPRPPVGGRHRYHWERFDALVGALARSRLRWLPVVGYSTTWAGEVPGNHRSPPRDHRLYARFAGAVAQRYGRRGTFWRRHPTLPRMHVTDYEIWNAPNFQATTYPAEDYADAYLAVRSAIRRQDPEASVWVGGLSDRAPAFLTAMYAARRDVRGNVDAVGLHPYGEGIEGVLAKTVALRRTLEILGEEEVPITITELGWATRGESAVPHSSDADRARRLAIIAEVLALSDCGVDSFLPHTWVTREQSATDSEHWFGIVHPDGRPTASGRGYAAAVRRVARWKADGAAEIPLCRG